MIVRNINVAKGLCNGMRMIVTELRSNYVEVKHLNWSESFAIPSIPLVAKDTSVPFEMQRIEWPLRLAFSMTINKAQGQTFERVHERSSLYRVPFRVRSTAHRE